tara:strand:+ start:347 stop:553 length:207 start_codon:yes stop_codon:yes gene_type:complete
VQEVQEVAQLVVQVRTAMEAAEWVEMEAAQEAVTMEEEVLALLDELVDLEIVPKVLESQEEMDLLEIM